MEEFLVGVGATSSAFAIVIGLRGAVLAVTRWFRQRSVARDLRARLGRLAKLDTRLAAVAVDLEDLQTQGTGWGGWDLPPRNLGAYWTYLVGLQEELEFTIAEVRAIDAEGPSERLRADIEELADVLRRAAELYESGSAAAYRAAEGRALGISAGGRAPIKPLQEADLALAQLLRLRTQLLFRTCCQRLTGRPGEGWGVWPIYEWEIERLRNRDLWRGSPKPIA